jgi:RNA polymerase sigma-70 factor, ECF subfamily
VYILVCLIRWLALASEVNLIGRTTLPGSLFLLAPPILEVETTSTHRKVQDAISQGRESTEPSDEKLVILLCAGDPSALNTLFTRYAKLVYGIAFRVLKEVSDAEDTVQECFLYVFRKASLFDPSRGSAKVWIVQIAYSRALDQRTHLWRKRFCQLTDIDSPGLLEELPEQGDMEREIEARVDFGRLRAGFDELTEIQRETLKLFYFEEMGLREISERLREPLGNVRHHFYRGLERLRKSAVVESVRKHHDAKD